MTSFSCADCKSWIYDLTKGKRMERGGKPQARLPSQPTPCLHCPKGSPDQERWKVLSLRNWATLRLYLRNRALHGRALQEHEALDATLQKNFELIDLVFRQHERLEAGEAFVDAIQLLKAKR